MDARIAGLKLERKRETIGGQRQRHNKVAIKVRAFRTEFIRLGHPHDQVWLAQLPFRRKCRGGL